MIGWEPVPAIPGGHEDVERCLAEHCGALVRRHNAGRRDHDLAFHVVRVPVRSGGTNGGYDLMLDDERCGSVYAGQRRYNLIRLIVDNYWAASTLGGRFEFETRSDALDHVVRANKAKGWAVGKHPALIHYPMADRVA